MSLLVTMCTFRKQWTFFETLKSADDIFRSDFSVITPKKIFRSISYFFIVLMSILLITIVAFIYYVFNKVLQVPPINISVSYLLANMPLACVIGNFFFSTSAIARRFYYINNILMQLSPKDIPKNIFEICSRTSRNDRHQPTIELNEIYSIYGNFMTKNKPMSPPSKGYKTSDEIKKEIKKLTSKLESRELNLFQKLLNKDVIEVEEYKLLRLSSAEDVVDHLTKLLDIHDMLLDSISLQNEILSIQILLIVAQVFVFEIFGLFSLYRALSNVTLNSNVLAVLNVVWLVVYNGVLYFIIATAEFCVKQGKLTGTYCHKVINKISQTADSRIIEKVRKIWILKS